MKKNKKVLGIVLCMAMAVTALAGCGAADTSAKKSDDTKAADGGKTADGSQPDSRLRKVTEAGYHLIQLKE